MTAWERCKHLLRMRMISADCELQLACPLLYLWNAASRERPVPSSPARGESSPRLDRDVSLLSLAARIALAAPAHLDLSHDRSHYESLIRSSFRLPLAPESSAAPLRRVQGAQRVRFFPSAVEVVSGPKLMLSYRSCFANCKLRTMATSTPSQEYSTRPTPAAAQANTPSSECATPSSLAS